MLVASLLGLIGPTAWAAPGPEPAQETASAPAEEPVAPVVVVGVAGLRWTDVSRSTTPNLWHMIGGGSVASINVRTAAPATCPLDAWLTLSAGSRTVSAGSAERAKAPDTERADGRSPEARGATSCTPVPGALGAGGAEPTAATVAGWADLPEREDDEEAEETTDAAAAPAPGLLGEMLDEAAACSTAVGPGAAVMLARENGRVDRYVPSLDALIADGATDPADDADPPGSVSPGAISPDPGWGDVLTECPVTVIEGDLSDPVFRKADAFLSRLLPQAQTITLPGSAHFLQIDQPELWVKAIARA